MTLLTFRLSLVWVPGLHGGPVPPFTEMSGGSLGCLDILVSAPSLRALSLSPTACIHFPSLVLELCCFACLAGSSVNGLEEPSIAKRLRGRGGRGQPVSLCLGALAPLSRVGQHAHGLP